jgi:hypothetical protein
VTTILKVSGPLWKIYVHSCSRWREVLERCNSRKVFQLHCVCSISSKTLFRVFQCTFISGSPLLCVPTEPQSLVYNKLLSPVTLLISVQYFISGNRTQMEYYWVLASGFTLSLVWPQVDLCWTSVSNNLPRVDVQWTLISGTRILRDFCWSPLIY